MFARLEIGSVGFSTMRCMFPCASLTTTQKRIEEINPQLLDIENRIAASTDQTQRTQLEGDRSKLATEYNQAQAREQELLAESQTLERYTSMFQTFVDSLNNQIAAQNTLSLVICTLTESESIGSVLDATKGVFEGLS